MDESTSYLESEVIVLGEEKFERVLSKTGYSRRATVTKGPWYYVHVIYIWNHSAEP